MATEKPLNRMDGRKVAGQIREEVKEGITHFSKLLGGEISPPKLCVILVGDRKDSATYVSMKEKACEACGIESKVYHYESSVDQQSLEAHTQQLSFDPTVDGILVQLPLPSHIDAPAVLRQITHTKDVDALLPVSMGRLALRGTIPLFKPCTAEGCVELCRRYDIPLAGKHVVILGRSNIVGMPAALLFQQQNATVTVCHSFTVDMEDHCRRADILVVAIGKPNFVKAHWIKDGVVILDVGINPLPDATKKSGYRLVGDVDFEDCQAKCAYITPVPGGIGPMTVAMLMKNTFDGWKRKVEALGQTLNK